MARLRTGLAALLLAAGAHSALAAGDSGSTPAQEGASALLRGNIDQAIIQYTDALKDAGLTNDRRGAILNDRAVAYARSGQTRLALDDFNRAVQLFAENPAAYNNRGNLLLALGLPKESLHDYDRAILLSPGYAAAYANRAGAYDRLGQSAEALRDYTRAVELMPQSAVPLAGRGRVLLSLGKPHAAIRDFTRAVNADARFANGYRGRATAKPGTAPFREDPAWAAKMVLHRVYYAQLEYRKEHKRWAKTLDDLGLAQFTHECLKGPLELAGGGLLLTAFVGDLAHAHGFHGHLLAGRHFHCVGQRGLRKHRLYRAR